MQVFNRQIANGVAASVKQNAVEIQIEVRACRGEIDVKCGRWGSRDMKAANHYWTKKWGIDLINAHREPFLSAFPPAPQSKTIRNCNRRTPNEHRRPKCGSTSRFQMPERPLGSAQCRESGRAEARRGFRSGEYRL